jgi:hypothetical protein
MAWLAKLEAPNSLAITPEDVEAMENWIRGKVGQKSLNALNEEFRKRQRRKLDYQDLAAMALIHAKSVSENEGRSPFARFVAVSALEGSIIPKPIHAAHVSLVLQLLEVIGFTKQIEKHNPKANLAGKYTVIDRPF